MSALDRSQAGLRCDYIFNFTLLKRSMMVSQQGQPLEKQSYCRIFTSRQTDLDFGHFHRMNHLFLLRAACALCAAHSHAPCT
jgi:hypothetical protein